MKRDQAIKQGILQIYTPPKTVKRVKKSSQVSNSVSTRLARTPSNSRKILAKIQLHRETSHKERIELAEWLQSCLDFVRDGKAMAPKFHFTLYDPRPHG